MKKTAAVLTAVTALLAVSSVSAQSSFTDDLKKSWQATKEVAADTWERPRTPPLKHGRSPLTKPLTRGLTQKSPRLKAGTRPRTSLPTAGIKPKSCLPKGGPPPRKKRRKATRPAKRNSETGWLSNGLPQGLKKRAASKRQPVLASLPFIWCRRAGHRRRPGPARCRPFH